MTSSNMIKNYINIITQYILPSDGNQLLLAIAKILLTDWWRKTKWQFWTAEINSDGVSQSVMGSCPQYGVGIKNFNFRPTPEPRVNFL